MTQIILTNEYEDDGYTVATYDITDENGSTVGEATIKNSDDGAYVERIDINEAYQNLGHGTAALKAISRKYDGVTVAPDNEDAKRLYDRIGSVSRYEYADYIDQGYGVYDI